MTAKRPTPSFLRRAFTENLGLKLIALVGSLVLFVMRGTSDDTGIVSARVHPPTRAGYVLVSDVPEQVHVTLSGSRALVNAVRSETLEEINIPDAFSERFFYIEANQFDLPPGVTVDRVEPTAIPIQWVQEAESRFRIDAVVEGVVAEGFTRVRTTVQPTSVMVRGAADEIGELSRVRTQPVDVGGLTAGAHDFRVPLMPLPAHVSYVASQTVTVTVVVEAEEGHRVLEDVEVSIVGGSDLVLRPSAVNVTLRGPRARVEELHERRVIPYVDASGLDPSLGAQPLPVRLRPLPEDISVSSEPAELLVMPREE
ncbi:MAG: YbbR-like domain-containing protein [Sandaracinaceae bacterium]|nr:YbbR-like domain-containing protein [Sandaracinaceae bacterium]